MIPSVFDNQKDLLRSVMELHAPAGFQCDLTFGNGKFWDGLPSPEMCFDIDPQCEGVSAACSTEIPAESASLGNVVFDPPFLTYVRSGRSGNGKMVMSKRFGGYWSYDELEKHYTETLLECSRVMRPKSVLLFKCQDIVHNHKLHATHSKVIQWAEEVGFRLKDIFILAAKHRMPGPNRIGSQKHARIFHSYFLVFSRLTERQEINQRRAA